MSTPKLTDVSSFTTTSIGTSIRQIKMFDFRVIFSDGAMRYWQMTTNQLGKLGADVTKLSQTKKLRDWILSPEGRKFFEEARNHESSRKRGTVNDDHN